MVILVSGTVAIHSGNYYLRLQKNWPAKGLLILGWVLAAGIAVQYYLNYQLAAPREISPEEQNRITEKMKEFAGQEYAGLVAPGVGDAWLLWERIASSLDHAGWKFWCCISRPIDRLYGHEASIWQGPSGGVQIFWPVVIPNDRGLPTEELQTRARKAWGMHLPAQALAKALTAEGLTAFGFARIDVTYGVHPVVVVAIGPRP
jgi:hypothetical protein